jgi:hypothetical protein
MVAALGFHQSQESEWWLENKAGAVKRPPETGGLKPR